MTGDLFTEWVMKLDSFFRAQDRKVALLVNNCSAHPHIEGLSNINLIFSPPNTSSVLQPMDQGVIRSLKAHYRHKIVRLCIKAVDNNEPMPKISILQGMKDFVSSWNAVSKETVINCFKKAGISKTNKSIEEADDDHYFKFLTRNLTVCEIEGSVDDAIDDEAPPRPSDIQLENAFETLQNASQYCSNYGNEIQSLALKLEDLMKMEKMDNLKQY
ncbi:tigger transposable element-derived protein 4-like [Hydra vulgaris]|uniref:Tigger transposable element-derived protein 4-like n=1 Tax=Hydra vulgaris TaxID=6087 RepID=A0ABM4B9P5_HYDVU